MAHSASVVSTQTKIITKVQHSRIVQILIWANCVSLTICGAFTFVFACKDFTFLAHVFVGLYLTAFGVLSVCTELGIPSVVNCFGFLYTGMGQALFFIFAGTLGLSFGVGKSAGVLIPFISGLVSAIVGVLCIVDQLFLVRRVASTTTTTAVEPV